MIKEELLNVICCPETKEDLVLADQDLVDKINSLIDSGEIESRIKQKITKRRAGGLIQKESRRFLYPIRNEIPILIIDESIPLEKII